MSTIWIDRSAQGDGPHRRELAKRHFEAEREQQERHAELRQLLDVMHVGDGQPAGERTDGDAGEDVADDEGLPKALRQEATGERRNQHEREIGDEVHRSVQRACQLAMTARQSPCRACDLEAHTAGTTAAVRLYNRLDTWQEPRWTGSDRKPMKTSRTGQSPGTPAVRQIANQMVSRARAQRR